MSFDTEVQKILRREGGYVNDPDDRGGATNFGISSAANPDIDVANLTREQAIALYKTRYWDAAGVDTYPEEMQAAVFDAAVQHGPGTAKKMADSAGGDLSKFNAQRAELYRSIIQNDPTQRKFAKGWAARLAETGGVMEEAASVDADAMWRSSLPRPSGDLWEESIDPLASAVKAGTKVKLPEWAQNAAESVKRAALSAGIDLQPVSDKLVGNEVAVAEMLNREDGNTPGRSGLDINQVRKDVEENQAALDRAQRDASFEEMVSFLWGETSVTKKLWDFANESPWHDSAVPEYTEPGLRYIDHMEEWEAGRSPDEVERLREIGYGEFTREDIQRELARQDTERKGAEHLKGWGTPAILATSLGLGTVGDPIGMVAGFGVFKGFEVAGASARAAFKAGQVAKGLTLGAAEASVGNVAVMAGLDALGEQYSASDYIVGASFGAALGVPFTALGIRGAKVESAMEHLNELRTQAAEIAAERNARFRAMAVDELGEGADPKAISARASELDLEDLTAKLQSSQEQMPDEWRLSPEQAEDEADVVQDAALGDMRVRQEGGQKWGESAELRAGLEAAEQSGKASTVLRVVSQETGTPEHMRALAGRLAGIADEVDLGYVPSRELEGEAATWAGAYFRDTHSMSARIARPEFILHEAVHGATSNILATPKAQLPEAMRSGVQRIEDLLDHVRVEYGMRGGEADSAIKALLDNGVHGPLGNSQEFIAYAMTNSDFQKFLSSISAAGGKVRNAWEWFKSAVADLLGLDSTQRTALDEVLEAGGALLDEVQSNPNSREIIGREASRAAARAGDAAVAPPASTLLPPGALLRDPESIRAMSNKYGLDATISDNVERAISAEMYARAERILRSLTIDEARLKPLLSKVGMEATSTRMLLSKNPLMRATGALLLENPEGAAGRRPTAALAAHVLDRQYRSMVEPEYESMLTLYASSKGMGQFRSKVDPQIKRDFDLALQKELEARWHGDASTTDNQAVLRMADIFDAGNQRMAKDAVRARIIGWARIPLGKSGYYSRVARGDRLVSMTPEQLRIAERVLSEEFQTTAGFDQEFSDKLAVKYMEIAIDGARHSKLVSLDLRSPDTADVVRDSLKAMGFSEEESSRLLGRFSRGGARMTRGRININLNATHTLEDGSTFRLGDLFETDMLALYKNYSRRMSGEIALTQFGIMGSPGVKTLRKAIQSAPGEFAASLDELESFDQAMGEILGMRIGDSGNSVALGNARAITSSVYLTGMGWTQMTEYGNSIHAVGYGGMFRAIREIPRVLSEARRIAKGEHVENSILNSVEVFNGPLGSEQYRLLGLRDVGDHAEVYGRDQLGTFSLLARGARHAVRVLSMQRAIEAVQVRGLSEQIVRKALRYVREGKEDLALADMGLTPELREAALRNMDATTRWNGRELMSLDLTEWDDQFMARSFAALVERGASQIIQKTYAGEVGKWAHSDQLKLFLQFREYPLIATQKQWRRVAFSQGNARAVGFILGSLSVTIPLYYARMALQSVGKEDGWFEERTSALELGRAAMRYTSSLGLTSDVFDAVTAPLGLTPYAGRSGVSGSIPAFSLADQAARTASQWKGKTPLDKVREVSRLVPGSGLPGVQTTLNWLLSEEP